MHAAQMAYANSPTARDMGDLGQQPKRRKASVRGLYGRTIAAAHFHPQARTTINLSQRGDELLKHLATQALLPKIRAINHAVALLLSEPLERLQIPKEYVLALETAFADMHVHRYALHPPNLHIQGTNISSAALLDLQRKAQTAKLSVLRPGHLIELFLAAHVDVNKRYSEDFLRRLRESIADPRTERNERSKRVRAEDDDGGQDEEEDDDPLANMMIFSPQPSGPPQQPQARDGLEPYLLQLLGFIDTLLDQPLVPEDGPNLSTLANRRGYREVLQALHRLQLRTGSTPSATIGKLLFKHLTGGATLPESPPQHLQKQSLVPLLLTQTKDVSLRGNLVGPVGAGMLCEGLRGNAVVASVDLSLNLIGDVGAEALADMLATNGSVTSLNLASNAIKDQGAEALARGLSANAALQSLDLRANAIGDRGAEQLSLALRSNHSLTSLCLWNNSITDAGGVALAGAIATSNTLQHLNLSHNLMGEAAAIAFANALHQNRSLRSVDLRNNAWGEQGIAVLGSLPVREDLSVLIRGDQPASESAPSHHDSGMPPDMLFVAAKQLQMLHTPAGSNAHMSAPAHAYALSHHQQQQQLYNFPTMSAQGNILNHQPIASIPYGNRANPTSAGGSPAPSMPVNPFATLPPILPSLQGAAE